MVGNFYPRYLQYFKIFRYIVLQESIIQPILLITFFCFRKPKLRRGLPDIFASFQYRNDRMSVNTARASARARWVFPLFCPLFLCAALTRCEVLKNTIKYILFQYHGRITSTESEHRFQLSPSTINPADSQDL